MYIMSTQLFVITVISQPDDVTVCKGRDAVFTCILNLTNSNTRYTDLEWYKFTSTSSTEVLDPYEEMINFLIHTNYRKYNK